MLFLKSVAIFLAAAIANPICCCTVTLSERVEPVETHQCCSTAAGEDGKSHDSEDCPHSVDKASQISQVPEVGDSSSKAGPLEIDTWEASGSSAFTAQLVAGVEWRDDSTLPGKGKWVSLAYCVYLL